MSGPALYLACDVIGTPIPQGSQRAFNRKGGGRPIVTADNAKTRPWKDAITWAAQTAAHKAELQTIREPINVNVHFRFLRPTGHYGARGTLLPSAPGRPKVKPDLDKLVRAVLDALTDAGVWFDDAQVVGISATKAYCDDLPPGVSIELWQP